MLLLGYSRGGNTAPLLSTALRLLEAYGATKIILVGSDEKELEKATGESIEVAAEALAHHGFATVD